MKWLFFAFLSYLFIDQELALFINTHIPIHPLYKILTLSITPLIHLILWGSLTSISIHPRFREHLKTYTPFFLSILIFMFIAGVLKISIGRARPDFAIKSGFYGFSFFKGLHSYFRSFPSSHAATAYALAYLYVRKRPTNKLIAYGIATVLISTRLLLREHYLSDLIVGGYIGILAARIASQKQIEQAISLLDRKS